MFFNRSRSAVPVVLGLALLMPRPSLAGDEPFCIVSVTRESIVACAKRASLNAKAERETLASFDGRGLAASIVLPSNPVMSLTGALPAERDQSFSPLWAVRLSQELEVAGQRGVRKRLVQREREAQRERVVVNERGDVAAVLELYFDALAARDMAAVAERSSAVAASLRLLARGQVEAGVASQADAILASSVATALESTALAAQQQVTLTKAMLAGALGHDPADPSFTVSGELAPLPVGMTDVAGALNDRPEIKVATDAHAAAAERVRLLQRTRIPNPSVALAARNDWVDERTLGIELSLPLPLPAPIGQTNRGQIAEAQALVTRQTVEIEAVTRRVRTEMVAATNELTTRRAQLALYDDARVADAETLLTSVAEEIAARRLPLRDALIMQRPLIDFLFGRIEVQRLLCAASVELVRVSGQPFVTGTAP